MDRSNFDLQKTEVSGLGEFVVLSCPGGYLLYSREEWDSISPADHEADLAGAVTFQGRPTGKRLTAKQMENAF